MATDLGELLVPYMPTIRVPRRGDRVFKSECAFSYDSPVSIMSNTSCMNVKLQLASPRHVKSCKRDGGSSATILQLNLCDSLQK
uniref:Ubiquitinyl hydrolase variant UBP zinc finger domain-containing protein n=1 Tax=Sinocyclocheilus anshuiensis TaxID=1608454 RepID=A0A671MLP9_9TELE